MAANRDETIGFAERGDAAGAFAHWPGDELAVVALDSQLHWLAAEFTDGVGDNPGVAVVDERRLHWPAGRDDFIAGGKNCHARLAYDGCFSDPNGGQKSRFAARESLTRMQHKLA